MKPPRVEDGLARHQAGRFAEAEAIYREVLASKPNDADALHLLGALLHQTGRDSEALELVTRAVGARGNDAKMFNTLGEINRALARRDDAVAAFNRALQLQGDYAIAHHNLALALLDLGRIDEAIASVSTAIKLKPDYARAFSTLGMALHAAGRNTEAIEACRAAIRLNPRAAENFNNLGTALRATNQLDDAIGAFRQAIALKPDHAAAHHNLGESLSRQGDVDGAIASYREALRIRPDYRIAQDSLLFAMLYSDRVTSDELFAEHRRWSERFEAPVVSTDPRTGVGGYEDASIRDPDRKLRIGYVSPDFRRHPVGFFMRPIFAHHDRERFDVVAYSNAPRRDPSSEFFRAHVSEWRDSFPLTDEQLAEQVRADRIDILVDLTLHMAGNRLLAFARKPAPIQVTYLGYPHTTGLSSIDYKLSDPHLDPAGAASERFHTEQIVRLPQTWFCCDPEREAPDVGELPARARGVVTVVSMNTLLKLSERVVETWSRILHDVASSRLLLIAAGLGGAGTRGRVASLFARHNIPAERLELRGLTSVEQGWSALCEADIALDPFPYAGGTTSVNALWMGLPLITLAGDKAVGRQGVSLNANLGLAELTADSVDRYVTIATTLARDIDRLAALRASMRDRMLASPLCDGPAFVRHLEEAYRAMWRRWLATPASGE